MRRIEIDIHGTTEADAETVWRLLGDSSTWPSWTPIESFDLERPGGTEGLGEIRVFKTGRIRIREEIVERDKPRRLSYTLLSGLAVRDYRADIDLTPGAAGTDIRWHTTFVAKVPGTGWLYRKALTRATRQFVEGLTQGSASEAESSQQPPQP